MQPCNIPAAPPQGWRHCGKSASSWDPLRLLKCNDGQFTILQFTIPAGGQFQPCLVAVCHDSLISDVEVSDLACILTFATWFHETCLQGNLTLVTINSHCDAYSESVPKLWQLPRKSLQICCNQISRLSPISNQKSYHPKEEKHLPQHLEVCHTNQSTTWNQLSCLA